MHASFESVFLFLRFLPSITVPPSVNAPDTSSDTCGRLVIFYCELLNGSFLLYFQYHGNISPLTLMRQKDSPPNLPFRIATSTVRTTSRTTVLQAQRDARYRPPAKRYWLANELLELSNTAGKILLELIVVLQYHL